jgi:eukaryotic-like serine/threonine-protein kinase
MASEMLDEKAIFNVARQIGSPDARAEYLRQACETDSGLRERVEVLLRAYEEQASFLESPPPVGVAPTIDQPASESPGTVLGPYKLVEQIGEGGMGTVWMAQQTEPVKRLVAVKLIKAGMDSRQVVARFEAERQALALMDHPNIARVLDGGTTTAGRPYFVMDLVKGVPITKYCDEHRLTPRQRLELFLPVCQAVQHAHQKGIIHRDLKPSNVLVALYDGKPVPKVIDFGVAKAAGQPLTEKTLVTGFGAIVGTLEYMSPEQAEINQLDIDTRSDIYSLGVLLYELLAGSPPFSRKDLEKAGMLEMLRVIREQEPSKPSTKLSTADGLPTLAANRGTEPAKLTKLVRGELDWIVMKALEKDRNRRYETANGFAMDIQRYLADEAVLAGPPSAAYKLRKFARRNKRALAAAAVLLTGFAVLVGSIGWVVYDRAVRQATLEQSISKALDESRDWQRQGNWPEATAAVSRARSLAADGITSEELRRQVRVRQADLEMVASLDEIYLRWGNVEDAGILEKTPGLLRDEEVDQGYAEAFRESGIDIDTLDGSEAARAILGRSVREETAVALDHWAFIRRQLNDSSGAERILRVARSVDHDPWRNRLRDLLAARQLDRKALTDLAESAPVHEFPPATVMQLADVLTSANETGRAIDILEQAQRRHPDHAVINIRLAALCFAQARWDDTIRFASVAVATRPRSPHTLARLSEALTRKGKHEEAVAVGREAVRLHPQSAFAHACLAYALEGSGELGAALGEFRQAVQLGSNYAWAHYGAGRMLAKQERWAEAVAELRQAARLDPRGFALAYLGEALVKNDRLDEAIRAYQDAVRSRPGSAELHAALGDLWFKKQAWDEAVAAYSEAIRLAPQSGWTQLQLGVALQKRGDWDKSIAPLEEAVKLGFNELWSRYRLGWAFYETADYEAAFAAFEKVVRLDRSLVEARFGLAAACAALQQWDRAETEYGAALEKTWLADNPEPGLWTVIAHREELFNRLRQSRPNDHRVCQIRGRALAMKGNWDAAAADFARALESAAPGTNPWWGPPAEVAADASQWNEILDRLVHLHPDNQYLWIAAAKRHGVAGRYQEAVDALQQTLDRQRNPHQYLEYALAILHAARADTEGYRRVCDRLLDRGTQPRWAPEAERAVRACLLLPDVMQHRAAAIREMAEYGLAKVADHPNETRWFHLSHGMAKYRAGNLEAARASLQKSIDSNDYCTVAARLLIAMVDHRSGQAKNARAAYQQAVSAINELSKANTRQQANRFHERLTCDILRREAEQLLKQEPGKGKLK